MFMGLLINIYNASNHTKCVSLSNQKCKIQPTFINLHPNECSQEFHYCPFTVNLDKCVGGFFKVIFLYIFITKCINGTFLTRSNSCNNKVLSIIIMLSFMLIKSWKTLKTGTFLMRSSC